MPARSPPGPRPRTQRVLADLGHAGRVPPVPPAEGLRPRLVQILQRRLLPMSSPRGRVSPPWSRLEKRLGRVCPGCLGPLDEGPGGGRPEARGWASALRGLRRLRRPAALERLPCRWLPGPQRHVCPSPVGQAAPAQSAALHRKVLARSGFALLCFVSTAL